LNITSEAALLVCVLTLEKTKKKKTQFNTPFLCFSPLQTPLLKKIKLMGLALDDLKIRRKRTNNNNKL